MTGFVPFTPFNADGWPAGTAMRLVRHASETNAGDMLSAAEEARIARLKPAWQQADLRQSLIARRLAVADLTGCKPGAVHLSHTGEGAPCLDAPAGWSISLSSITGMTAVAVCPAGWRIGIDIADINNEIEWEPMLRLLCTDEEESSFCSAYGAGTETLAAFYRLWTIKEAVLKATGRGMRAGAKNVPVDMAHLSPGPARFSLTALGTRYMGLAAQQEGLAVCLVVSVSR